MKVLFLTLAYPEGEEERNIYTDLMQEFKDHGHEIYVVCSRERRLKSPTQLNREKGINVLRVRTGNLTKTNIVEKGISTLLLERQFINAIEKYIPRIKFDLVLYSTPPITFEHIVSYLKSRDQCRTYLLLKDIFPQNAVDIGMMKKGSLVWKYFRKKEKRLYYISDHIGCMSPANVKYLLEHNPEIDEKKVEVCPNSIRPKPLGKFINKEMDIREEYGIPRDAVLFIYGGNLGRPQGIDFLIQVIDHMKERKDIFFLIVGSGTEFPRIENFINISLIKNTKLIKHLPTERYDNLLSCCDVGLIFLDPRFTIPNFPSRLTSYMEHAKPILAATDRNTDIKDILQEAGCGFWVESGHLEGFVETVNRLASNLELRNEMGLNGRKYLEKYFTAERSYEIITHHFKRNEVEKNV